MARKILTPLTFNAGGNTINNDVAGTIPLIIKGAASQTASLQEWQNSSGTILASVSSGGTFSNAGNILAGTTTALGRITSLVVTPTVIGAVIRGAASQTADLQQWQNSSGTVLAEVDSAGALTSTGLTLSGATSTLTVNTSVGTDGQVLISKGPGATPQWSSLSSTFTGGTLTSALILKSGASGSGEAPLYFGTTTPSLLSTPAAGAFEFNNVSPYFTNSTSVGRGVVPSMNFFSLGSNRNITDGTSNSSIFGKSLTVEANRTYYFKVVVGGTKGTTNAFVRFLMTGTATLSAVAYLGFGTNGASPDTAGGRFATSAAANNITAASTGTSWSYMIEGKFSVAAGSGGTWIPTCNFSATTGTTPTVTAGSYVYIYPISSTTTGDVTIGAWA